MFDADADMPTIPMTPVYRDYLMRGGRYSKEKATFADFKLAQRESRRTPEQQVDELKKFAKLELMVRRPRSVKSEAEIGEKLEWGDPYVWATLTADANDRAD